MKYGLYVRKSSEDSRKQIQSIDDQISTLLKKAKVENICIHKIYKESKSAKKPHKRKEFNQMIQDLEDGVIDGIIWIQFAFARKDKNIYQWNGGRLEI